ncbi:MAG: bacteriocin [Bacteroidales bacterium]|nr:bacteriocin [Bacteroidales bacterium]
MKNLKLTNLERMNEKEMQNVKGGKRPHPWIGITFKPKGPCVCVANCDTSGQRANVGHSIMGTVQTK